VSMKRYIPALGATVVERPGVPGGQLIEIPDDNAGTVVEWHCDVAAACDGGPRPRVEHQLGLLVDGPGYPPTKVGFSACAACCKLVVPNTVRLMLAAFGVDLPPGLMPD
jgi:hypothetical protein